jgi:cation diffusion facilitator CzcD-associated flavoprotein CzcO
MNARNDDSLPSHARIAIIGAGFSGLGAGIRLRQAGQTDFVIIERADSVGGIWRDNTYPGCTCDVPSNLYSLSFAPNPNWSRSFSPQPEIWRYLDDITNKAALRRHIRFGTEVTQARWDSDQRCWQIETTRGSMTAQIILSAAGTLSEPVIPDIPGVGDFDGKVFHTGRWDHDCDLAGKRIAVIGTGASAVQIVPKIQPSAGRLMLFQRTPAWVMAHHDRPVTGAQHWLYRTVPAAQRVVRAGLHGYREALTGAFVQQGFPLGIATRMARGHLEKSVPDPRLRAALTPDYTLGCKRILLSSHFYPALAEPNVELIPSGLAKVDGGTLTAQDGTSREADVIIFATGFRARDWPIAHQIHGRDGQTLAQSWASGGVGALRATTIAGFPNLCLMLGPNTGISHNSVLNMLEAQLSYVLDYVSVLGRPGIAALDARPGAQQKWEQEMDRRGVRSVWTTGGCDSWYLHADGRSRMWPGTTRQFRKATRRVDLGEYEVLRDGSRA